MGTLLLTGARQLLTLRGSSSPRRGAELNDLGIIEGRGLLAENGVIREVGPARRIENLAAGRGAKIIDAAGGVVMPGFVDAGTDLFEAVKGGARSWTPVRLQMETRRALNSFTRHGTTTIEAKVIDEKELKVLQLLDGRHVDVMASIRARTPQQADQLLPRGKFAQIATAHCGPEALSLAQAKLFLTTARRSGYALRVTGPDTAAIAVEFGALVLERPQNFGNSDLELLAGSATMVLLTPIDCLFREDSAASARRLVERGAAIAIGSGFGPSAPRTLSMPMLLSIAVHRMGLTPAEAITASTINGAHALSIPRLTGSLEPGKQADFIVFSCSDYRDIPAYAGVNLVSTVIKRGVVLHEEPE